MRGAGRDTIGTGSYNYEKLQLFDDVCCFLQNDHVRSKKKKQTNNETVALYAFENAEMERQQYG